MHVYTFRVVVYKVDGIGPRSSPQHQELCFLTLAAGDWDACVDGKAFSSNKSKTSCSCDLAEFDATESLSMNHPKGST